MQNKLKKIFNKDRNIVIGALHFPPLLGYPDFPGMDVALENALKDLSAFEKGGVDAIIFENNYDFPHKEFVDTGTIASMTYLGEKIKKNTNLPLGISVLWNDYKTALTIAKILDLQFVRIPVFVDDVKTNYGKIKADAEKVIEFKKKIDAENILIFTDIHVKHAEITSDYTLEESAKLALEKGSDGLILTGKWTGESPDLNDLKKIKTIIKDFPVILGSGIDITNIKNLFEYSNGAMVSTSLKEGEVNNGEINVKSYKQRIDLQKVEKLTRAIN